MPPAATGRSFDRFVVIVCDSLGCGDAPDAAAFSDEGANTLASVIAGAHPHLPNLSRLGLDRIPGVPRIRDTPAAAHDATPAGSPDPTEKQGAGGELQTARPPLASWGRLTERGSAKDTMSGHWELMCVVASAPFPVYPDGFPRAVMEPFERAIGRGTLGNVPASGTEILERLGAEHLRTGKPIVYTSADSVFQVAAHEEVIPVAELYEICATARAQLDGEHRVARVIARPFVGSGPDGFRRTAGRRDYALPPPRPTALDLLVEAGLRTFGVGKIHDIFAGRGLTGWVKSADNADGIDQTLAAMHDRAGELIFTNLVDFDTDYGHRRDVAGYAAALEAFDAALPRLLGALGPRDCLVLTADHGTDPGFRGTDHTRERVPLLVCSRHPAQDLGTRKSYADLGQTVLDNFGLRAEAGTSFLESVTA
jgi:phosphopentomutase